MSTTNFHRLETFHTTYYLGHSTEHHEFSFFLNHVIRCTIILEDMRDVIMMQLGDSSELV
jgi:hypothetical protein